MTMIKCITIVTEDEPIPPADIARLIQDDWQFMQALVWDGQIYYYFCIALELL